MAKKWSGFIPQNVSAMEQWAMMEALELRSRTFDAQEVYAALMEPEQDGLEGDSLVHLLES